MSKPVSAAAIGLPNVCQVEPLARRAAQIIPRMEIMQDSQTTTCAIEAAEAKAQERFITEQLYSIEAYSATLPAHSPLGAIFHIMVLSTCIDRIEGSVPDSSPRKREAAVLAASATAMLYSVLSFVEHLTGASGDDAGGEYYLAKRLNPHRFAMPIAPPACHLETTTAPEADKDLIALGAMLKSAYAEEREVYTRNKGDRSREAQAEKDLATNRCGALSDKIEARRALTFDGVLAKVQAIAWCRDGDQFVGEELKESTDVRLALSIANDLLQILEGGAVSPSAVAVDPIYAAIEAHKIAHAAFNNTTAQPFDQEKWNEIGDREYALWQALAKSKPVTLAGAVAFASYAATYPDLAGVNEGTPAELLTTLAEALRQIGGAA